MNAKWRAVMICLLLYNSLAPVEAAEPPPLEYQVKAAFLLNFTKFVEWPESAFVDERAPFEVCVLGEDPFGSALDQIVAGEAVGRRRIVVLRIRQAPTPKSCQLLFVGGTDKDIAGFLSGIAPGVLSVGEADGFLKAGGAINFLLENRRVRFDINQAAAEKAQLRLSSRLLRVARLVER